jgi:Protein of unknown function (DUF2934)
MMADDRRKRTEERAYELWQREGQPEGRHLEHWLAAEREDASGEEANEGEGNRTAAREYNRDTRDFVESGEVETKAREAEEALDGPEAKELAEAEEAGKRRSRGEDPALRRRS